MVDYSFRDLFKQSSVDKQIKITYDGGSFTNTDIPSESFELSESLCSENSIRFGACETNSVKFTVANHDTSLLGKRITVTITPNNRTDFPFQIGKYNIVSDKPTADRIYREVEAYDDMYDILNAEVSEWYNDLSFPMTLKNFRNSFFNHLDIQEVLTTLPNDDMEVKKTIETNELTGKDVICAICEINGRLGNIDRNGKFKYVKLESIGYGLYPSNDLLPGNDVYPSEKISFIDELLPGDYISCDYEDWHTNAISGVSIKTKENDVGVTVGSGNTYEIQSNFLVYGKDIDEMTAIANNILDEINDVSYAPFMAEAIGDPCVEVGDAIKITTNRNQIVESYVLERKLSGIQALVDDFSAKGSKDVEVNANSTDSKIKELLGKSNVLERTINETKSEITDVDEGLKTLITQTAEGLSGEIEDVEEGIRTDFNATAEGLQRQITGIRTELDNNIVSYNGSVVPTLTNYPAKDWTTDEMKANHVGNMYFVFSDDDNNGKSYKFKKDASGNYLWEEVVDTVSTLALQKAVEALNKANATNDTLVASYETKEENHNYVEDTLTDFSRTLSTTYTTSAQVNNITNGKLANYYNKTQTESKIQQSSDELSLTVAGSQATWMIRDESIDKTGYGEPSSITPTRSNLKYLDVSTGIVWISENDGIEFYWEEYKQLEKMESSLKEAEAGIKLKVDKDSLVSELNASADIINLQAGKFTLQSDGLNIDEDGNVKLSGNAEVSWDAIENAEDQVTTITKNTVTTTYVNALNVKAGSVAAENITGTTISGKTISGGRVDGAIVYGTKLGLNHPTMIGGYTDLFGYETSKGLYPKCIPELHFDNGLTTGSLTMKSNILSSANNLQLKNDTMTIGMYSNSFRPNASYKNIASLGTPDTYWNAVYSKDGTISKSDRNLKKNIKDISGKLEKFFYSLRPKSYVFKNGKRTHIGAISQDVEQALNDVGLTNMDFAGFCKDVDENGKDTYSLRYQEFIMLNTHMIQKQKKEIDALKEEVKELKNMIKALTK